MYEIILQHEFKAGYEIGGKYELKKHMKLRYIIN
jgi:hypothetical protein